MKNRFLMCLVFTVTLQPTLTWADLPSSSNIQLWFRADAGVTTNGTGNVSVWADQSGIANNATNLTLANQPLWIDNALNGKPVLRFDGVNDELSTLNNVNLTNGLSIFIVAMNAVRKDYNGLFRIHSAPYSGSSDLEIYWQAGSSGSGNPVYGLNRGGTFGGLQAINVQPPAGNYYLYDVIASTIAETQRVSGVTPSSSPLGAPKLPAGVNPAHIGIGVGFTSGILQGDIAEVVVYNTALSTTDRTFVENFLADKYGLTIPEPSSTLLLVGGLLFMLRAVGRRRTMA